MTIDCSKIVKYARICDKLKDDSQPVYDSGLLDFERGTMTFGSQRGFGCVSMPVEGWDGKRGPFFVNLGSFLNVAREFPTLELDGFTFRHGDDGTFDIARTDGEARFPPFIENDGSAMEIGADAVEAIRRCGMFTDVDGIASLNGVFIKDGSVWGTNRNRMCEARVDSLKGADIALPRVAWETIAMDILGPKLTVFRSGSSIFVSNGDDMRLQFVMSDVLASPDIHNPLFVAKFDHESGIVVDRDALAGVVVFIQPFVAQTASQKIQLIVGDSLEVKADGGGNIISRRLPILGRTGGIEPGSRIWVGANWLRMMLGVLPAGMTRIQIDLSKPAINISAADDKDALHIVYCRIADPAKAA